MKNNNNRKSAKKARREARKNYEKQAGLYMSLFTFFEQAVSVLTTKYMPCIKAVCHEDVCELVLDEAKEICKSGGFPDIAANCISGITMSMLENMCVLLDRRDFIEWYDEKSLAYGAPVVNENRQQIIASRIVALKPGATERDFVNEIRKDLLNFVPKNEVDEQLDKVYSVSRLNGEKLEPTK